MKLRRIKIEDFRQIVSWEHSFLDSLGRARDLTLLVGPNASGKTSILDAVACALSPLTRMNAVRPGLDYSLKRLVRHGAVYARVGVEVEFTHEERDVGVSALRMIGGAVRGEEEAIASSPVVSVTWTYPDPQGRYQQGAHRIDPPEGWSAFRARSRIAHLLATQRLTSAALLEQAGAIFTFDQQRALFGRKIPRAVWEVLASSGSLPQPTLEEGGGEDDRHTTDPRLLLLSLAIQDVLPVRSSSPVVASDFERVRSAYARVCHPHTLVGAVRDDLERFDLEFLNGQARYRYADMSSGEQMVLLVLLRMVSERIHRSIVLFDEVELHQHPIWQRRLMDTIERAGVGNQIIATTHSNYLRDIVPPPAVIELGDLGDRSVGRR